MYIYMKYTNETFIKAAKLLHGLNYDYSLVNYAGRNSKINIICSIHGKFNIKASRHLFGKPCPKCPELVKYKIYHFPENKICKLCNILLVSKWFIKQDNRLSTYCINCTKIMRKRYNLDKNKIKLSSKSQRNKYYIFIKKLKNTPCFDCNLSYDSFIMEFDHRDPKDKLFAISARKIINQDILLKEIEKCDIVCANCHRKRTFNNLPKLNPLGDRHVINRISKKDFINKFKDTPCADCNIKYLPYQMDFDHLNPNIKLFSIANGIGKSYDSIKTEIDKCELVCANCHKLRTHNRKQK